MRCKTSNDINYECNNAFTPRTLRNKSKMKLSRTNRHHRQVMSQSQNKTQADSSQKRASIQTTQRA